MPLSRSNEPISLSVIIPLFNEEAAIRDVLTDHFKMIARISDLIKDWEIVCLDDGSSDGTLAILQALQKEYPKLRILKNDINQGINASFMRLHREAKGTHIYHTAGDGQWPAGNCEVLLRALINEEADVAIGVRKNRKQIYTLWRRLLSWVFNLIPLIFYGIKTADANGIKLARRRFFEISVRSKSFFAEIERIIKAHRLGLKISYAEVGFLSRSGGKEKGAKFSNIVMSVGDMLRYLFNPG